MTPEGYRHRITMSIRYADMDSLGHVNNARYMTYFEQARITYINDLNLWDGQPTGVGMIVARATIDFKLALRMSDGIVDIWTRCSRLGTKSFDMQHHLIRTSDGALAATGQVVVVVYDYRTNTSTEIPDDWRAKLIEYEPALKS